MTAPSEDQTADLWLRIDQLHLNYLKSEHNTKKLEIRKKLEGYVKHYLYLVPQDRKFCSGLAAEVIWQSARWIPNFSALKAASAFEAIEKYAANLINQPWRKEFKTIKQYGGFYKHQVESCLSGAEKLFHQMGYVSTGQETLELSGAVDQDRATVVARDCLLAYMECQIVVGIVQRVSVHFPCSWEDALDFRRDHIGTTEQAVRALIYLKNQSHHQINNYCEQQSLGSTVSRNEIGAINENATIQSNISSYPTAPIQALQNNSNSTSANELPFNNYSSNGGISNNQFRETNANTATGNYLQSSQPCWSPPNCMQQSMQEIEKLKLIQKLQLQQQAPPIAIPNHFGDMNSRVGNNEQPRVPTGNLIEVQSTPVMLSNSQVPYQKPDKRLYKRESSSSSSSTLPGQGGPIPITVKQLEDDHRRKSVIEAAANVVKQGAVTSSESWDYVYRQLENSGYSKDQADRPDVLELLIKQLQLQKEQQQYTQAVQSEHNYTSHQSRNEYQSSLNAKESSFKAGYLDTSDMHQSNEHLRVRPSHKANNNHETRAKSAGSKLLDDVEVSESDDIDSKHIFPVRPKSSSSLHIERGKSERYKKPLVPPNSSMAPPGLPPKGKQHKNLPNVHSRDPTASDEEMKNKWECQFCTFLNEGTIDICEICAKSRILIASSRTTLNSPKISQTQRSHSALSQNSSKQTTTQGSSNAYYSEEEEDFQDVSQSAHDRSFDSYRQDRHPNKYQPSYSIKSHKDLNGKSNNQDDSERAHHSDGLECSRCTLVNSISLKICEACGATLGLDPIETMPAKKCHNSNPTKGHHIWQPSSENLPGTRTYSSVLQLCKK